MTGNISDTSILSHSSGQSRRVSSKLNAENAAHKALKC